MVNLSLQQVKTSLAEMSQPIRALKAIYRVNAQMSWLHRIEGVDLSRCFEYAKASEILAPLGVGSVLDVGSYRSPFPIYLAGLGYRVILSDVDPVVGKQRGWAQRALQRETMLSVCVADGAKQPFPTSLFDIVTCISTIEHVPGNGDVCVIREIGRVLKPSGSCFITVPHSCTPQEGSWGRWFQRWYSMATAVARLVEPSGLSLKAHGFMIGGAVGKMVDTWYGLPRLLRHALSWSHILFFHKAVMRDAANEDDARVLWLLLQKC